MALTERSSRIEEASRGSEQIAALFASIGKQEQIRRERQQLDSIAQLVSRTREEGRDATTQEILSVLDQPAEIGTGLQGFFQKLGGRLQPEPGRIGTEIRGGIVSSALKRAMAPEQLLTPEEQAQARRVKARIAPPAKAPAARTRSGVLLKQIDRKVASGSIKEGSKRHLRLLGASGDKIKTPEDKLKFWQTVLQKTIDAIGSPLKGQEGTAKLAADKIEEAKTEIRGGTLFAPEPGPAGQAQTLDPDISDTDLDKLIEELSK